MPRSSRRPRPRAFHSCASASRCMPDHTSAQAAGAAQSSRRRHGRLRIASCAPWPDVVLVIGRQLSCVALWIKQQSRGATRIALLNAPKGRAADFDLVVLPPYYRNRTRPNVLAIRTPLIGIDRDRIDAAGEAFAASIATLPRPLHVLLVGGDMGQRKLKARFVAGILREMQQWLCRRGLDPTSAPRRARPPPPLTPSQTLLRPQDRLYRWRRWPRRQPLSRPAGARRQLHRHRRQPVDADRGGASRAGRWPSPNRRAPPASPGSWPAASPTCSARATCRQAVRMLYEGGYAVPLGRVAPTRTAAGCRTTRSLVGQRLRHARRRRGRAAGAISYPPFTSQWNAVTP